MKFADLEVGRRIVHGPVRVDADEMIAFARKYDNQWFHTDPMRAESSVWNGLIASGWHTCAIAMSMVAEAILKDSESFASPGLDYVKWPHPVRPNDMLTLNVLVLESRISATRPSLGIVRWQWMLVNQDERTVLDLEAASMFDIGAAV
jgi:acyl dehydratase